MKNLMVVVVFASIIFGVSLPQISSAQKLPGSTAAVSHQTRAPQLGNVRQFKEAFQNDAGKVRLVALVSPT